MFVGPPTDQLQPTMISRAENHQLCRKVGRIAYGPTESLRCYPDERADTALGRMVWVEFENDREPIRQVGALWLVKEVDL